MFVIAASAFSLLHAGNTPKSMFIVYAAGTPDSYGNQILSLNIQQNQTGSWATVAIVTNDQYTPSMNVEVDAGYPTRFAVSVKLNYTMASSTAEAETNTRVYITVATKYTSQMSDSRAGSDYSTYWYVLHECYTSGDWDFTTASDTTYAVTIDYDAYY